MAKPPAKPAAKEEAAVSAPPKNKKVLLIVVAALLVSGAAGAGFFFGNGHSAETKAEVHYEPKFIPLGENFTVNLQREEGDQYLQAGITLKVLLPEAEQKVKNMLPEIRSKLLFLLSSKKPSELQSAEGKKKLISEIIAETDAVIGVKKALIRAAAPVAASAPAAPEDEAHEAAVAPAAPAPSEWAPISSVAAAPVPNPAGVVDVLFTSFIIQ